VERLDPADAGLAGDASGRRRRQMRPFSRERAIGLRAGRLDEENVRVAREPDNGFAIGRRVSRIGDIGDLLPGVEHVIATEINLLTVGRFEKAELAGRIEADDLTCLVSNGWIRARVVLTEASEI
jgi:hypothetical protein